MARNPDIPKPAPIVLYKTQLLNSLSYLDDSSEAKGRILKMENDFRERISTMNYQLPSAFSQFRRFNTNPFVLLLHAGRQNYTKVEHLDRDVVLAKVFSSLETSAGRMVEEVTLPIYDWEIPASEMHTPWSIIDGVRVELPRGKMLTLKSGPRCLNDEMSENFADSVIAHAPKWAEGVGATEIEFTYGVLYGTPKISNKKDWHILRNIVEKGPSNNMEILQDHRNKWSCSLQQDSLTVEARVHIGLELWAYLGGPHCALEVWTAMIRACIVPSNVLDADQSYNIADMASIVSTANVPLDYNVGILQRSQLPWLFLMARHFCDDLI